MILKVSGARVPAGLWHLWQPVAADWIPYILRFQYGGLNLEAGGLDAGCRYGATEVDLMHRWLHSPILDTVRNNHVDAIAF